MPSRFNAARNALCLAGALCSVSTIAHADNYALIIANSDYENANKLDGVKIDFRLSQEIARKLGVPEKNIIAKENLDGPQMRQAFQSVLAKLNGNDSVFVYYSGHGARFPAKDGRPSSCTEFYVAIRGNDHVPDTEISGWLEQASEKAKRVIVMADSCFSGGAADSKSAISFDDVPKFAKFANMKGAEQCTKIDNLFQRAVLTSRSKSAGPNNIVYIAASRSSEVSWDSPKGGVATSSWLSCLNEGADSNGSGVATIGELRTCAQTKMNLTPIGNSGKPSTMTIVGEANMPFSFGGAEIAVDTPNSGAASGNAQGDNTEGNPAMVLQDLHNGRDDRIKVTMTLNASEFKVNKDSMRVNVTSNTGGYLYLLTAGSDGKTIDMLFPNKLDQDNQIAAGTAMSLPRKNSYAIKLAGPIGRNSLVAIVSDQPKEELDKVMRGNSTAFKEFSASTKKQRATAYKDLADDCGKNAVITECKSSYGSVSIFFDEVR